MWGVTVGYAAILRAASRTLRADSLVLKVRSQEARRARRLHGGSDLEEPSNLDFPLIASLITDASLCGACLARKTGLRPGQMRGLVNRMAGTVTVTSKIDRCNSCLQSAVVYRLGNASPRRGASPSPARQVIEELESAPLCTKCLATRLGLTLYSVQHVVAEFRGALVIDTIEPCHQCGSRKTITLHGHGTPAQQEPSAE
jgi:hypothetical protein